MAFINRHAPEDTAIKPENMTENIDVRGLGRYYPEEHGGQIQAVHQRGQLIADVPKTLAGIILNYNEHALSTWQNEQVVQLQDKALVNDLLVKNRKQQMELSTDLEIYDAQEELESQIFEARKMAGSLGEAKEEEAVNEVLNNFKDKFQGRLIPNDKWQKVLQNIGRENLAKARISDWKTDQALIDHAIQNEFNKITHSAVGLAPNPDGTFQPIMDIQTAMDTFVNRISPFISDIEQAQLPNLLQKAFNTLVQKQGEAYVELFQKGQINADTLMNALQDLRETFGGESNQWTFRNEKGEPIKNADGSNLTIDTTLDPTTELFLSSAYRDAKNGVGNGGNIIVDNAIDDFKKEIGYDDIQKQGWSKDLLSLTTRQLQDKFVRQVVNVIGSTASDEKKTKSINELFKIFNTGYMLSESRDLINDLGPDALTGLRQIIQNINDQYANNRENFSWEDYKGNMTINGKTYSLNLSPIGPETKGMLAQFGIDLDLIAPRFGDSNEESAQYWKSFSDLLQKYADSISNNNLSDILYTTDSNIREDVDTITNYFTTDQIFTQDANGNVLKENKNTREDLIVRLNNIKTKNMKKGSSKFVPITSIDSILSNIDKMPNIIDQVKAKEYLISVCKDAGTLSDLYNYTQECLKQGKPDGGLLSLDALANSPEGYKAYLNALNNNTYQVDIKKLSKDDLKNRAMLIRQDLNIPIQDFPAYENLEQYCMLAAYDPNKKEVDTRFFEKYYREALSKQYIQFENPMFSKVNLYKNHPALNIYANNMDRLQSMAPAFKKALNAVPNYLHSDFKNFKLTPGMDGIWYLAKNGELTDSKDFTTGRIYDEPSLFDSNNVSEIAKVSVGLLESNYITNNLNYNDYLRSFKSKQRGIQIGDRYDTSYISVNSSPMTQEQYIKKHAARVRLGRDPRRVINTIKNYNLKIRDYEGAIKDINSFMQADTTKAEENRAEINREINEEF